MQSPARWTLEEPEARHTREEVARPEDIQNEKERILSLPAYYRLLDAALWEEDMSRARETARQYRSLYRGSKGEELEAVAPFLLDTRDNPDLSNWILGKEKKDYKNRRFVSISSTEDIDGLRKHLRRFLRIKREDGLLMYFRYYDPWVLACVLPNLTDAQAGEFFRLINYLSVTSSLLQETRFYYFSSLTGKIMVSKR